MRPGMLVGPACRAGPQRQAHVQVPLGKRDLPVTGIIEETFSWGGNAVTRSLSRKQSVLLGLLVLTALGLGAVALFALGQRYGLGRDAFRVTAAFADVGGVEPGTRVRIQGIDAGDVEEIVPPAGPGAPVRLKLRLAGKYRHLVTNDARVQIAGEGLLPGNSLYTELSGSLGQINAALRDMRDGEGTLGKLVKSTEMYSEAVQSLHDVRTMVASVKQNADAIKSMPIIRNYVVDGYKELVRPHCKADVGAYAEWAIFTPGTAVLTSAGRKRPHRVARRLYDNKGEGTGNVLAPP